MGRATAFLLTVLVTITARPADAQTTGDCNLGEATADLDMGNVRARMYNRGGLFWIGGSPVYEVPRGSGSNAIFTSSLWIGEVQQVAHEFLRSGPHVLRIETSGLRTGVYYYRVETARGTATRALVVGR